MKLSRQKIFYSAAGLILLLALVLSFVYLGGSGDNSSQKNLSALSAQSNQQQVSVSQPSVDKDKKTSEISCPPYLQWKSNARQMYDYELETRVMMNPAVLLQGLGQKNTFTIAVKGILNFRIFGNSADAGMGKPEDGLIYAGFQLSPVKVTMFADSFPGGKEMTEVEKMYQTFFMVAYSKEGIPLMFHFPNSLDEKDKSSLSEIVKMAQIFIPEEFPAGKNQDKLEWRRGESHSSGTFEAEYSADKTACDSIIKKNIRYLAVQPMADQIPGSEDIKLRGHIVESEFKITLARNVSWAESYSGSESSQIYVEKGKGVLSESESKISLKLRTFEPNPALAVWTENKSAIEITQAFLNAEKANSSGAWEKERLKGLAERFKNVSLPQVISEIKNASSSGARQSDLQVLTHNLRDFLEVYPQEARDIPRLLKEMNLSDQTAGCVILALQLIGHAEAQAAIRDIFEDKGQISDNRLRAIVASGEIQHPEKELIQGLFTLSENRKGKSDEDLERADTAILSLGIMSDTLSKSENPSESQMIDDQIISKLQDSEDERERIMCLKSIDNSEKTDILPEIEPYLTSASPLERATAIGVLGNFSDENTMQILANALENDAQTVVRESAIDALTERGGIDAVEHLRNRLIKEPDENLRGMMIRFLGKNKTPSVVDTLRKQLGQESSKENTKDIYRALYEEKK